MTDVFSRFVSTFVELCEILVDLGSCGSCTALHVSTNILAWDQTCSTASSDINPSCLPTPSSTESEPSQLAPPCLKNSLSCHFILVRTIVLRNIIAGSVGPCLLWINALVQASHLSTTHPNAVSPTSKLHSNYGTSCLSSPLKLLTRWAH